MPLKLGNVVAVRGQYSPRVCNDNYWSDTYSFHQTKKPEKPKTEEQQIQSEIERLCRKCGVTFVKVAENKYRVRAPLNN